MRVLRAADHRRMPWKNGGGVTTEIAIQPENAGMDGFDWRLSMALVAQDGPFSLFPGIDRVLAVLEGEGLSLAIDGGAPLTLTRDTPPLAFAADVPVHGALPNGPVTDLNLMVRRGLKHAMRRIVVEQRLATDSRWTLVFNPAGELHVEASGERVSLGPLDACLFEGAGVDVVLGTPSLHQAFLIQVG